MQYQIISTDEHHNRFVLYIFEDLELARKMFEFIAEVALGNDDILTRSPSCKSIELQEVKTLGFRDVEKNNLEDKPEC